MSTAKALEVWTAQTLCAIGILLSIVSFLLHIGRPYFERILKRFSLRVAADLWWVVYVVLRDGTLFLAFLFGFLNLNLDLMADIKVGLPFVPFGTVALAASLLVKVFHNAEDVNKSFRLSTHLVTLGAFLNTVGYALVMEAPGEEHPAAKNAFWQMLHSWRSNENPQLAALTFYVTFSVLICMAAIATVKAMRLFGKAAPQEGKHV